MSNWLSATQDRIGIKSSTPHFHQQVFQLFNTAGRLNVRTGQQRGTDFFLALFLFFFFFLFFLFFGFFFFFFFFLFFFKFFFFLFFFFLRFILGQAYKPPR